MRPFTYQRAGDLAAAIQAGGAQAAETADPVHARTLYIAGGTTVLDLAKLDVLRPQRLVDINALKGDFGGVRADASGLRLGALARMAAVADDAAVKRDYPVIAQSLMLAASPQLRNMASLGGNVLQRTRCSYFRDSTWKNCNKREPGSGCAAIEGVNRRLAVLGTSEACIANYPGDFAQALVALDAAVQLSGPDGNRTIPFEQLHRLPESTPHQETNLKPGEVITGFTIVAQPWYRRSLYLKIRDRDSYDFALASAAVALDLGPDGKVAQARVALGGVATKPWRSREAEQALQGVRLDEDSATKAAEAAFAGARANGENAVKVPLGRQTLIRALLEAQAMDVSNG